MTPFNPNSDCLSLKDNVRFVSGKMYKEEDSVKNKKSFFFRLFTSWQYRDDLALKNITQIANDVLAKKMDPDVFSEVAHLRQNLNTLLTKIKNNNDTLKPRCFLIRWLFAQRVDVSQAELAQSKLDAILSNEYFHLKDLEVSMKTFEDKNILIGRLEKFYTTMKKTGNALFRKELESLKRTIVIKSNIRSGIGSKSLPSHQVQFTQRSPKKMVN